MESQRRRPRGRRSVARQAYSLRNDIYGDSGQLGVFVPACDAKFSDPNAPANSSITIRPAEWPWMVTSK